MTSDVEVFSPDCIWGNHSSRDLHQIINACYEEIVYFRKNLFLVPSGKAGKNLVREMTRVVNFWNDKSSGLSSISLKVLMCMPALLLQKPHYRSKTRQHTDIFNRRLTLWNDGDFDQLIREATAIQTRMIQNSKGISMDQLSKTFAKHMRGMINAALRLLENSPSGGVLQLNDDVINDLKKMHPSGQEKQKDVLLTGTVPTVEPIIFESIDANMVMKAALKTKGADGPSGMDSDSWRSILTSKYFGSAGSDLRSALARMIKILCTEIIDPNLDSRDLEAYLACRLIPLNKCQGVRPIGIGEILRRIFGKVIIGVIRPDIINSAGSLELCAGQKAGCEASVHAMTTIFKEEETDAILLVDAS